MPVAEAPPVIQPFSVNTPVGTLVVDGNLDGLYPGIWIELITPDGENHPIACVEYFEDAGLRTLSYVKNIDDPEAIIPWDDKDGSGVYRITISGMPDIDDNLRFIYSANNSAEALGKFFKENECRSFDEIISIEKEVIYSNNHAGWDILT